MLLTDWCSRELTAGLLFLRPVIKHDTEFVLSLYQDWRVAQHLSRISVPFTPDEASRIVDTAINEASNSVTATYIAHLENEPVGLCLLHHGQDKREARIGVIGYSVVPAHWGEGYASSMVGALVDHATLSGFGSLQASMHMGNVASRRVLEKAGFSMTESGFMEDSLHSPPRKHSKYTLSL